jgi:hypothetical protein
MVRPGNRGAGEDGAGRTTRDGGENQRNAEDDETRPRECERPRVGSVENEDRERTAGGEDEEGGAAENGRVRAVDDRGE